VNGLAAPALGKNNPRSRGTTEGCKNYSVIAGENKPADSEPRNLDKFLLKLPMVINIV
jgi:hypothetical protein